MVRRLWMAIRPFRFCSSLTGLTGVLLLITSSKMIERISTGFVDMVGAILEDGSFGKVLGGVEERRTVCVIREGVMLLRTLRATPNICVSQWDKRYFVRNTPLPACSLLIVPREFALT